MQGEPSPVEVWERRPGASLQPLRRYHRREPEKTLLHAIVRGRLEPFLAAARDRSPCGRGLPAYVERDLRAYLDCGILAHGFARIRCPECHFERLVAFSCKARSCPSCNARRMEDGAEHLVEDVFPAVPVRQWVLSLPRRLRFVAARDKKVASRVLDLFTRVLFARQRRSARQLGVSDPRTAGVTAIQRFGGAINLNVHFHTLVPDGVFDLTEEGPARFVQLPAPGDEEVERILRTVIRKVAREIDPVGDDGAEEDAFAALQAQAVDRRLRSPDPFKHARRSAHLDGYSLHAGVRIHANDREGRERLCRYALRPPFALDRLSRGGDGRLLYEMKRPRDGALFLSLTPEELLARMATLVPPPRTHALRYHGLFAPNAKHRARVVPAGRARGAACGCGPPTTAPAIKPAPPSPPAGPARQVTPVTRTLTSSGDGFAPRYRVPWAELLRKVFAIDVLECPRCAGRLQFVAYIADGGVAKRILDHLGMQSQAPPVARAASAEELPLATPLPDYDVADPTWAD